MSGVEGGEFVDDEFREREFLIADGLNDGFREFVAAIVVVVGVVLSGERLAGKFGAAGFEGCVE